MKHLLIFLFIFSLRSWAGYGVVLVLEAPIFKEESWDSKIMTKARIGDKIFIHDKHFGKSSFDVSYHYGEKSAEKIQEENDNREFFQTLDESGRVAYIPTKYVKLIYNDSREMKYGVNVRPFDPTDYRLKEPLAKDYPLYDPNNYRSAINFHLGPSSKTTYLYPNRITYEDYGFNYALSFWFLKRTIFQKLDRFYFGLMGSVNLQDTNLYFSPSHLSRERIVKTSIGPQMNYDLFRSYSHRISISGGLSLHYTNFFVYQSSLTTEEERNYTQFSFAPDFFTSWQWLKIFSNTDLILGMNLKFDLGQNLTATTVGENTNLWNDPDITDYITLPFGGTFSLFLGLQFTND